MYIIIGNDREQRGFAIKEAQDKKEAVRNFEPNCFKKDPNDVASKAYSSKRITFRGHGQGGNFAESTRGDFGHFTPDSFVQALKEYGLPKSVKEIDLVGCNIGLRVDPKTKSFIEEVANLLTHEADPKFKHYQDIQVRAFYEENLDNIYSSLLIHRHPNKKYQYAKVYTKNEYDEYKNIISEIKDNKNKDATLDKNIQELNLTIEELNLTIEELEEEIDSANNNEGKESILADAKSKLKRYKEEQENNNEKTDLLQNKLLNLGKLICNRNEFDSRKILDANPNFLIRPISDEKHQLLSQLIDIRKQISTLTRDTQAIESHINKTQSDLPQIQAQLNKDKVILEEKQAALDAIKKMITDAEVVSSISFRRNKTKSSSSTSSSSSLSSSSIAKRTGETEVNTEAANKRLKTSAHLKEKSADTRLKDAEAALREAQNQYNIMQAALSANNQELPQAQSILVSKRSELTKLQDDYNRLKEQITRLNIVLVPPNIIDQALTSGSSSSSSSSGTHTDSYDSDNEDISLPIKPKWTAQKTHPKWSSLELHTELSANDEKSHILTQETLSKKEEKHTSLPKETNLAETSSYRPH